MTILCTHGIRKHAHTSIAELTECIEEFYLFASPAQAKLLIDLGYTSAEVAVLTRENAEATINASLQHAAEQARGSNENSRWRAPRTIPF